MIRVGVAPDWWDSVEGVSIEISGDVLTVNAPPEVQGEMGKFIEARRAAFKKR